MILGAIASAARPRRTKLNQAPTPVWAKASSPEEKLKALGAAQEQHIRRQIGKMRQAAVHRSGYFYKTIKRWRTGVISQYPPQPPVRGTQHVLNHFAGDPKYDPTYCRDLIRKHGNKWPWDTSEPTREEFRGCLRAPKHKSAGTDGVPPSLLRHLPHHMQQQRYQAILDIWRGHKISHTSLASRVVLIYKKKDPQDPKNY